MIGDTLFFSPMGLTKGVSLQGQGLYSFGVEPDVYLNFAAGYSKVAGVVNPVANALTCVRASTRYIDNVSGNWTLVGANLSGISNKGLLVEEARTNGIRNNSMQGAVVSGALPTNWLVAATAGLATSVVAVGSQNGIDYIDLRIAGTTSATTYEFDFEAAATNAASPGQVWTESLFVALQAGSLANVTTVAVDLRWAVAIGTSDAVFVPTALLTRYSSTGTAPGGTTQVKPSLLLTVANGAPVDLTLRIGWPQLEQGAWATSPIRTTNAAVTRAADVVSLTSLPTFGGSFSLYGAGTSISPTTAPTQWLLVGVAGPNSAAVGRSLAGGGGQSHVLMTGGIDSTGAVWNPLAAGKLAAAFAVNDQVGVFNGGTPFTIGGTTGTPSAPTSVQLGSASSSQWWSGYITEAAIWAATRLTNAQLQAGTT